MAEKRNNPKFMRTNWTKLKRLGKKWRRPKGRHSKIREKRKGRPSKPSIGRGSPYQVRETVGNFAPVMVNNTNDLSKISDVKNQIAILSSSVGLKKSLEIASKAEQLGIRIFNSRKVKKAKKVALNIQNKKRLEQEKPPAHKAETEKPKESKKV